MEKNSGKITRSDLNSGGQFLWRLLHSYAVNEKFSILCSTDWKYKSDSKDIVSNASKQTLLLSRWFLWWFIEI